MNVNYVIEFRDIVTNNLRAYSTFFGFMVFCHGLILYAAMYTGIFFFVRLLNFRFIYFAIFF